MNDSTGKTSVRFNQQQLLLLDNLKRSGKLGSSYEEVIRNAFREYVKQTAERSQS